MIHELVDYYDPLTKEEILKESLSEASSVYSPDIHYNSFKSIKRKYFFVLNNLSIESELNLIEHLNNIYSILEDDGYYILAIKDKRYTEKYFLPETDELEVIDHYYSGNNKKSFKKFIENKCNITHGNSEKHWVNDHGFKYSEYHKNLFDYAFFEWNKEKHSKNYNNNNNYVFTPHNFTQIIKELNKLNLIKFKVYRLYKTVRTKNVFFVVLNKL